jgi:hypothetical protein
MHLIIASILAYFIFADPSFADPITAAITAIAGVIKAGGIAAVIIKGLAYVALSLGVGLLQKALAKKQDTAQDKGVELQVKMGDDYPISFPVGNYATGGKRKFIGVWGSDGKTPNAFVVDVIELSNIPISGLIGVWADDKKLTLNTGAPHPEYGFPVTDYSLEGQDYMWIKFYSGSQTVADPYLTSRFQDREYWWNDTFIGTGCAYAIVTCRFNENLYSGLPTFTWEPGSAFFYDIRKDSTNGGFGSHRWTDRSTWESSSNPVVIAYNIIRGIYYGNEWIFGGRNLAAFRLPSSNWIAAANACDLSVVTTEGSEPSFRCGYEVVGDQRPIDVAQEILKGANARIAEVGGIFKVLVGAPGAAVFSFTDNDIIVTKEQNLDPFPNLDSTINGIEATYPEPIEKWSTKDAPARYNPVLEVEDGGRRLTASVSFPSVPFKYQVQRLMLALIQDYRRFRVHQIYLSPEAYALEPNDVVSWTSERNGYVDKKFLVVQIESDRNFNQFLTLKEIDPSDYDWNSGDELPTSVGWVGAITPPPHPMYGWQVFPAIIYDAEGNARRPSIKVSCDPEQEDVSNVHIQVRLKSDGTIYFDSDGSVYVAPYEWILQGQFPANVLFQARGRFIHFSDQSAGEWSEWLDVTTPNVLLTNLDVYVDINTEEIIEFVEDATEWIREGVRQTILESQETARKILDLDFGTYTDRQQLRRELSAVNGDITAKYTETISAAVGPNSAIAFRLEEIESTLPNLVTATAFDLLTTRVDNIDGEVTAQAEAITSISAATVSGDVATANFRMGVSAGPSGYASRIALEARTGGAGTWRSSGLFIDVPASAASPSRLALMAEQIILTNGAEYRRPFVYSGGVLYLDDVRVNSLSALSSVLGNVDISNANIGTLTVGTSNIQPGAITAAVSVNGSSLTVTHGTGSPIVLILWKSRGTMSTTIDPPGLATATMVLNAAGSEIDRAHSSSVQSGATAFVNSTIAYVPGSAFNATTFDISGSVVGPSGQLQGGSLVNQITALVFKR